MNLKGRSLFSSFLLLAFLAGAWGNVLAAVFCPRMASVRACCLHHKSSSQSSETHDMHEMDMGQMADMQMDMSSEDASTQEQIDPVTDIEQETEATVVDRPIETCSHCLSHSQLPLGSATLREAESVKHSADLTAAPQINEQLSLIVLPSLIVDQREHAPPGSSSPRHILINVFRI